MELKELTGNNENFRKSLEEMDAADDTMNSPICFSKLDTKKRLNDFEFGILKELVDGDIKCTLPSPYLLTRSMPPAWVTE